MKINWGTGIAIFYTLFVILMVGMVINSTRNKVELVQENYYQKDLNYEEFRLKRQNAAAMVAPIKVDYQQKNKSVRLQFPSSMSNATGQVTFFRPSNKSLDQKVDIVLNKEGMMNIPVNKSMIRGLWKVQLDWESDGKHFFTEESIVL